VGYRLRRKPMFVHCCHCTDCQVQTGGAFAINALIEASEVEVLSGQPKAFAMKTESGRPHDIYRCPHCAVALWSDYGRRGWLLFVRVSTLDRPHDIVPDVHIFTRSKLPWVLLAQGARMFDVYYEMAKEWPTESLDRRRRAEAEWKTANN
jgi:hypothetical protein